MAGRTDWLIELTPEHRRELLMAAAAVGDTEISGIDVESFDLPTLAPVLAALVAVLATGRGFVLLRGLPVEGLAEPEIERMFWGLGCHLGTGIPQNAAGDLLVHVRDQGLDFSDPEVRGYQTTARLEYHSDSSDVVGLLCVRPAPAGGVSTIVSAAAIHDEAMRRRPDLADILTQPWWWDRRQADLTTSFFQRRIFALVDGAVVSYYGRAHIESATRGEHVPELTGSQLEALDLLDEISNDPVFALDMHFRPGDAQFLNNYRIWHARTEYVDHVDPELRRDLCRVWLTLRVDVDLPNDFASGGITDRSAGFIKSKRGRDADLVTIAPVVAGGDPGSPQ